MKRIVMMTACAVVALATFASMAQAKRGIYLNGPALDGRRVVLPMVDTEREVDWFIGKEGDGGTFNNGPALSGQRVNVPVSGEPTN